MMNFKRQVKQDLKDKAKRELCHECGQTFHYKYELVNHLIQIHNSRLPDHLKRIKNYCLKKMRIESIAKRKGDASEKCSECEQWFEFKYELARHMDEVHGFVPMILKSLKDYKPKKNVSDLVSKEATNKEKGPQASSTQVICPVCKVTSTKVSSEASFMKSHLSQHLMYDGNTKKIMTSSGQEWARLLNEPEHQLFYLSECLADNLNGDPQIVPAQSGRILCSSFTFLNNLISSDDFGFTCVLCNLMFMDFKQLKLHKNTVHKDIVNKLIYVGPKKEILQFRKYKPRLNDVKICDHCGEKVNSKWFREHIRAHANFYECNICHLQLANKVSLRKHKQIHSRKDGDQPYVCDHCGKSFWYKDTLKKHLLLHAEDQGLESKHKCGSCDKVFSTYRAYMRHKYIHKDDLVKQTICFCGEKFSGPRSLKVHKLKMHFTPRRAVRKSYPPKRMYKPPAKCDICQQTFSNNQGLTNHKATKHSDARPFKCEICKMTFKLRSGLQAHQSIHTGVKPYECDVCHLRFRLRKSLRQHQSVHTGEKPHQCPMCGQAFRVRGDMNQHLRRHN